MIMTKWFSELFSLPSLKSTLTEVSSTIILNYNKIIKNIFINRMKDLFLDTSSIF